MIGNILGISLSDCSLLKIRYIMQWRAAIVMKDILTVLIGLLDSQ